MKGVGVFPARREVRLVEHDEPSLRRPGDVKLRMLEVGVCGTDRALCKFEFGTPPPADDHFILGHESLAEVVELGPEAGGMSSGALAVIMVRQPCGPPPCIPCGAGRQDFCASGGYREHGIKELHGFMTGYVVADRSSVCAVPRELRRIAVLVEPLTIAEKALEQYRAIERRLPWPKERPTAAVLGAGPVGTLGAMLLRNAGFETWVYSREESSPIADAIGAQYVCSRGVSPEDFARRTGPIDFVYEAMGAPQTAFDVLQRLGANGLFVLTGVTSREARVRLDAHELTMSMVVRNLAIVGTVNAGPGHFADAVRHLSEFERRWPGVAERIITGRFPLEGFREAIFGPPGLKKVIEL